MCFLLCLVIVARPQLRRGGKHHEWFREAILGDLSRHVNQRLISWLYVCTYGNINMDPWTRILDESAGRQVG
jgi:hypothetical protein